MILTSIRVKFEEIDITEPGREEDRELVKQNCKTEDGNPLPPPHFFNDGQYCGVNCGFQLKYINLSDMDIKKSIPPPVSRSKKFASFNCRRLLQSFEDFDTATESDRLPWFLKLDPAEFVSHPRSDDAMHRNCDLSGHRRDVRYRRQTKH